MTRISNILAILCVALFLTGCAALSTRTSVGSSTAQNTTGHDTFTNESREGNTITRNTNTQNTKKKDTAKPAGKSKKQTQKQEHVSKGALAKACNGEWTIVEVDGKKIPQEGEIPYLNFDTNTGKFYASNGCNIINGLFGIDSDVITFGDVITTMMICPDAVYEQPISAVLRDGVSVVAKVHEDADMATLTLSQQGRVLMTLRKHDLARLNGQWQVVSLGNTGVADPELNIFIDSGELKVHGNTGCNYFNGTIEIDPTAANSISFSGLSVTMRACPNADFERQMLVALEEATKYHLEKGGRLVFLSSDGSPLMTLVHMSEQAK